MLRHYSVADKLLINFDTALRTLWPITDRACSRKLPCLSNTIPKLNQSEQQHVAGLMRVNHAGEVCAQALYQGQALTAKLAKVRDKMQQAAEEEVDHLAWCETRLQELNAHTSYLNPLWYSLSFSIGAFAGALGDKWSLGFVVETEKQVSQHLKSHLRQLPKHDVRSKAILEQRLIDETIHAETALQAGGAEFPNAIKQLMSIMSKLMTYSSYYI